MKILKRNPLPVVGCVILVLCLVFTSCSNDDDSSTDDTDTGEENENSDTYIMAAITGTEGDVYIINQNGDELFSWDIDLALGNDANLLEDGSLVVALKTADAQITFGGYGGIIRKINTDKTTDWEITYAQGEEYMAHHDVEYLANGNILFPVWEKVSALDAATAGFEENFDIYPEAIIEMNPLTEEIVWEWHSKDHLIQNYDATKANFGVVADNPNKIDINYNKAQDNGDLMHINGITLDEINDIIYVTVNNYSEVWVIDHSTTTAEAATNSGGTYNLGGDLIYRFGNPLTYDNSGDVTLNLVHYPNLLENGNMLVYGNEVYDNQSEVIEYQLNPPYQLVPGQDNEPSVVWSFTDPELYTAGLGGAVRMDNGNTLITEARAGTLWEVSEAGDIVQKYETNYSTIWRAYVFSSDDPAITALGL
ncbi:aryl-sulfate sulfotransferase [Aquimarina addita]|uniref:Aryl-sulfate sulfotransferase n=1 Tax=Aquimarina addita TaxID=870485 RepID=A0ABP7X7I2_9FLAO